MFGVRFFKNGKYDWIPSRYHVAWKAFEKWQIVFYKKSKRAT